MLRSYYGHGDASVGEMVSYDSQVLAERERLAGRLETLEVAGKTDEPQDRERAGQAVAASTDTIIGEHAQEHAQSPALQWDVFNSGRRSSVLVFSNEQKK